jgi:uncharacterized membrane protein YtjA (UPF0391 family)
MPVIKYAAIFLFIAMVAAIFGFGVIALAAAGTAKMLLFVLVAGFILSGMRHRVESLGGKFEIDSGPNRGTAVRVSVRR